MTPASSSVDAAEVALGCVFGHRDLAATALAHPSARPDGSSYQRLEFLGDAVLELIVREHLLELFPEDDEGLLTRRKGGMVSRRALARRARALGLDRCVESEGLSSMTDSVLAAVVEALLGAVYLDSGLEGVRQVALRAVVMPQLAGSSSAGDPCSRLQEHCQAGGLGLPEYSVERTGGPDHRPEFEAVVRVRGTGAGSGRGNTRREARKAAAESALSASKSWEG